MYWSDEHYLESISEEMKREKILVSCNENDCEGTFETIRHSDDFSPRIHNNCSKCERFMSVKLSSIDENRIISREVIEEY